MAVCEPGGGGPTSRTPENGRGRGRAMTLAGTLAAAGSVDTDEPARRITLRGTLYDDVIRTQRPSMEDKGEGALLRIVAPGDQPRGRHRAPRTVPARGAGRGGDAGDRRARARPGPEAVALPITESVDRTGVSIG